MVYIDDIIIHSKDFDTHIQHIKAVLKTLQEAHIQVKHTKCKFATQEINYLGITINPRGIKPDKERLRKLLEKAVPTNKKELKNWLGIAGYWRIFVPSYAKKVRPLQLLTHSSNTSSLRSRNG